MHIAPYNNHGRECQQHSNSMLDNTMETEEARVLMIKCLNNYIV